MESTRIVSECKRIVYDCPRIVVNCVRIERECVMIIHECIALISEYMRSVQECRSLWNFPHPQSCSAADVWLEFVLKTKANAPDLPNCVQTLRPTDTHENKAIPYLRYDDHAAPRIKQRNERHSNKAYLTDKSIRNKIYQEQNQVEHYSAL